MLPKEYRIQEYDEGLKLLDDIRKELEAGNLMSITIVCETTGGELYGGCTRAQNAFAVAGYLMAWAMDRIGFVNSRMFRKRLDGSDREVDQ